MAFKMSPYVYTIYYHLSLQPFVMKHFGNTGATQEYPTLEQLPGRRVGNIEDVILL